MKILGFASLLSMLLALPVAHAQVAPGSVWKNDRASVLTIDSIGATEA